MASASTMKQPFEFVGTVPWGRCEKEYGAFFALDGLGAGMRVLDCGGGPASFPVEMSRRGVEVVSIDPLYHRSREEIEALIEHARERIYASLLATRDRFSWDMYGSPEALVELRLATMRDFLSDYETGRASGRYVAGGLPELPFADASFDLVLSSHFLFLYSKAFDAAFHERALREMARVGREVRVFPLVDLDGQPSELLPPVRRALESSGLEVTLTRVPYEFQRDAHTMMSIKRSSR